MPTYEYRPQDRGLGCQDCQEGLEVLQAMSDPPLQHCPTCGCELERVFTGCGVNTRPSGKSLLTDSSLRSHGFKKFVREDEGYRQTV